MRMMVILLFLILLNGCQQIDVECIQNSDCAPAGCSGQVCVSADKAKDIITTCEFKEEYKCLKLTSCGCVSNKCQWKESEEYKECLEEVGA